MDIKRGSLGSIVKKVAEWTLSVSLSAMCVVPPVGFQELARQNYLSSLDSIDLKATVQSRPFQDPVIGLRYEDYLLKQTAEFEKQINSIETFAHLVSDYLVEHQGESLLRTEMQEKFREFSDVLYIPQNVSKNFSDLFTGEIMDGNNLFIAPIYINDSDEMSRVYSNWEASWGQTVELAHKVQPIVDQVLGEGEIDLAPHVDQVVAPCSVLRNTAEINQVQQQRADNAKKTNEMKAEQYAGFLVSYMREWQKQGVDDIVFADRGARPLGQVIEHLYEKLELSNKPNIHYHKITSERKVADALEKIGDLETKANDVLKNGIVDLGIPTSSKVIVFDDWSQDRAYGTSQTKDTTVQLMQELGYSFDDEDFNVFVSGTGGGNAAVNPRQIVGSTIVLPEDWGGILDYKDRQLEIGSEYGIDRVKDNFMADDNGNLITADSLLSKFDVTKGPHRINLSGVDKNNVSQVTDYLVENYKLIDSFGYIPFGLDEASFEKVVSSVDNAAELTDVYSNFLSDVGIEDEEFVDYRSQVLANDTVAFHNSAEAEYQNLKMAVGLILNNQSLDVESELGKLIHEKYSKRLIDGANYFVESAEADYLTSYVTAKVNNGNIDLNSEGVLGKPKEFVSDVC